MTYIGVTLPGLEAAAMEELHGEKTMIPGRVKCDMYDAKGKYYTISCVYELWEEYTFDSLDHLKELVKKTEIKLAGSFVCLGKRKGDHDFNSIMLEQEIGKILQEKGGDYARENPEKRIIIDVVNNHCFVGLLLKQDLEKRRYRLRLHKQTMPPLLAAGIVRLYTMGKEKVLVAEAKDGVLAIEAVLAGRNVHAVDGEKNSIKNMELHAKIANVTLSVEQASLKKLAEKCKEKFDVILTQFIFSPEKINSEKKLAQLGDIKKNVGAKKLIIITNHPEIVTKTLNDPKEIKVTVGKLELSVLSEDH